MMIIIITTVVVVVVVVVVVDGFCVHNLSALTRSPLLSAGVGGFPGALPLASAGVGGYYIVCSLQCIIYNAM